MQTIFVPKRKPRCVPWIDPLSPRRRVSGFRARAVGALLLAAALVACERPAPQGTVLERIRALDRPNIVWIIVDTLRPDALTPYSPKLLTTPELARWASHGVVFENVRAQSSWTKTSMASNVTSLWPRTHKVAKSTEGLAASAVTMVEALNEAGYTTYGVVTNGWLEQNFGFQQGFDRYMFPKAGAAAQSPLLKTSVWPHAQRVLEEATRFLESHDGKKPYFLYLHFMDAHEYASPPGYKQFGVDTRGTYLGAMNWIDEHLMELRQELDDRGFLDNTIIVFGSDHGETFGENGSWGHARNVMSAVLRVPLIVSFPFPMDPIRVATRVRNIDVAPTILDLAGIEAPPSFEGRTLLPLLDRTYTEPDRTTHASLRDVLFPDGVQQESVIDGHWSYVRNVEGKEREYLFDRSVDPSENVNLIDLEPKQAEKMRKMMDEFLSAETGIGAVDREVNINPETKKKLQALGYLQEEPEN